MSTGTDGRVCRYGVLNADMFGHPSEPGEYVNWSEPEMLTGDDFVNMGIGTAEFYAATNPHMIVFELDSDTAGS